MSTFGVLAGLIAVMGVILYAVLAASWRVIQARHGSFLPERGVRRAHVGSAPGLRRRHAGGSRHGACSTFDVSLRSFAFAILLAAPLSAATAGEFTSLHPEEAHPDPKGQPSPDAYSGFVSKVQEKLREAGFDAGPVNGDFGAKTQAALAQFQLSRTIPASGQLDDMTLAELGVQRERSGAQQNADNKSDAEQNADKSDNAQNANSGASVANDSAEKTPTSEKTGN